MGITWVTYPINTYTVTNDIAIFIAMSLLPSKAGLLNIKSYLTTSSPKDKYPAKEIVQ